MRRLLNQKSDGSSLKISVLACSKGAEVYSLAWTIRSARPDLKLSIHAVDISQDILEFAERGVYFLERPEASHAPRPESITERRDLWNTRLDQNASIFERITDREIDAMCDREGDRVRIKSWLGEGITWHLADAGDAELVSALGP